MPLEVPGSVEKLKGACAGGRNFQRNQILTPLSLTPGLIRPCLPRPSDFLIDPQKQMQVGMISGAVELKEILNNMCLDIGSFMRGGDLNPPGVGLWLSQQIFFLFLFF